MGSVNYSSFYIPLFQVFNFFRVTTPKTPTAQ